MSAPVYAVSCSTADISPIALACAGRYTGNVLDNSAPDVATQISALAALGFTWDGTDFGGFPKLSGLGGATSIDFPGLLNGITYVGIHVGGGKGGGTTSFYRFDAGTSLDAFTLNLPKSSGAVLYGTEPAVPEPSNWALMLGGFAMLGGVMRLRRAEATSLA